MKLYTIDSIDKVALKKGNKKRDRFKKVTSK